MEIAMGNGCTFSLMSAWRPFRMVENGKSKKNRLRVCRVVDVPLHEVSGICVRRSRTGRMSLMAVGDRASKIAWFSLPRSDENRIDWHTSGFELSQDIVQKVLKDGPLLVG
jgi:hypothetical protein